MNPVRLFSLSCSLLLLAGCAGQQRDDEFSRRPPPTSPSDLVSAEIAFNQLAQEKGQWTAFRETATPDAVMFVPNMVQAQTWLKGRANPAQTVKWQSHKVFMSCDGTLGATTGAAQWPDGSYGYFTTIWQRQKNGSYKWVADHGGKLTSPRPVPEIIETRIADCRQKPSKAESARPEMGGGSNDDSLVYAWYGDGKDGVMTATILLWNGVSYDTVINDKMAAQ